MNIEGVNKLIIELKLLGIPNETIENIIKEYNKNPRKIEKLFNIKVKDKKV